MSTSPGPGNGFDIRPARADDPREVDRLYEICLRTSAAGEDATALFSDPRLPGSIFVGPYLALAPELAWVLERGSGPPSGYVLGVADTVGFERALDEVWWPELRRRAPLPGDPTPADTLARRWITHPRAAPADVVAEYPAHLHIDLLPEAQGGGNGARLISTLLDALRVRGVAGVHLGVGTANERAVGFYRHLGFELLLHEESALYLGMRLT